MTVYDVLVKINLLQSVGFEKSCREDYRSDKRWVQREGCEDCIRLMDAEEYLGR